MDLVNMFGVNNQAVISTGEVESVDGFFVGFTNGSDSSTSVTIQGGGTLTSAGGSVIGFFPGSTGALIVTGIGSTFNNPTPGTVLGAIFEVGAGGTGSLTVSAGAAVNGNAAEIGSFLGSGTALVTDPGSSWTATTLVVGNLGAGILNIANGGNVSCEQLTISESVQSSVSVAGGGVILNVFNDNGSGVLTVGTGNGSVGQLAISDGGTVYVSGYLLLAANTSTAVVTLSNGNFTENHPETTLQVGGAGGIQADPTGAYTFNFGDATIQVVGSDLTTSINLSLNATQTSSIDTNGFNATFSGNLTGSGQLSKIGSGNLTLTGTNTFGGSGDSTFVRNGTLIVDTGSFNNSNALIFAGWLASDNGSLVVQNGGNVTTQGVGIGIFTGANGSVVVTGNNSILNVGSSPNTGLNGVTFGIAGGTGCLTLANNGTLQIGGTDGILAFSTYSLNLAGGNVQVIGADFSTSVDATLANATTSTMTTNGFNATWSGNLSGNGALNVTGGGTFTLSGINSYNGGTTLNGGTLQLGSVTALGSNTSGVTVNSGTLNLNGQSVTVGALAGAGGTITDNSAGSGTTTLTSNSSTTTTYSGVIADGATRQVALTLTGNGMLVLNGNNTYSGNTTVVGGNLQINGMQTETAITVGSGAMLSGNAIVGDIVLSPGAMFSVAAGGYLASEGNFTWGGAATAMPTTFFILSNTGNTSSALEVDGAFIKGAGPFYGFDFQNTGFYNGETPTLYSLLFYTTTDGFSPNDFTYTNLGAGLSGIFSFDAGNLDFTVVPEPANWGLCAGGLALLWVKRRKRNRN